MADGRKTGSTSFGKPENAIDYCLASVKMDENECPSKDKSKGTLKMIILARCEPAKRRPAST